MLKPCITALTIALIALILLPENASAQSSRTTRSTNKNTQPACSQQDLALIKKHDRLAKRHRRKMAELRQQSDDIRTPEEAEEFRINSKPALDFFKSDTHRAMKVVYERCGRELPGQEEPEMFWNPGMQ